jgi:hypothetical protein
MDWVEDDFKIWLPKSQCELDEYKYLIHIPRWLLRKKAEELELQDFRDLVTETQGPWADYS